MTRADLLQHDATVEEFDAKKIDGEKRHDAKKESTMEHVGKVMAEKSGHHGKHHDNAHQTELNVDGENVVLSNKETKSCMKGVRDAKSPGKVHGNHPGEKEAHLNRQAKCDGWKQEAMDAMKGAEDAAADMDEE